MVNKALWGELACDHKLWRGVYLDNDPLVTPEIRKRMLRDFYTRGLPSITHSLPRSGLQHSAWLRCCCLLHSKPRLVLLLAGRDPVVLRRLGESEDDVITLNLGLNYHLDSYLDEDSRRFAAEFPQVFQDLDAGDLVVTQDFKGAGLYAAVADPASAPFMQLKKCGRDSAGFGILGKDQAPPMFPLLYYCDAHLHEVWEMDRKQLLARQLYWYGYTMLADKSMFNWATLEVLESL
uniref:Uncharacterized protein n=1 Tax=Tetradesmus obliquus TaxID=3088 RepID=A0A383V5G0_TETOB